MAEESIGIDKRTQHGFTQLVHVTDEPHILGVTVSQEEPQLWVVFINVAEFVREEPLEAEFRSTVERSLSGVNGVKSVVEADREVWVVEGNVQGEELLRATVSGLKTIHEKLKAYVESIFNP